MKKLFIIGNWKSNITIEGAYRWFEEEANIEVYINQVMIRRGMIDDKKDENNTDENAGNIELEKEVIICPSFTTISVVKSIIEERKLPYKTGSQDVSQFEKGAFTGQVNAEQIKELGEYVIIGHSERRNNLGETDEVLKKKVDVALKYELTPIFCVQNDQVMVPDGVKIVAYEPPTAIGTGNPDTPENADSVAGNIKGKYKNVEYVLYGGSVTSENVQGFVQKENINGVLVGGASLDPVKFTAIIKSASS